MNQICYTPSRYKYNNFCNYIESLKVNHSNLPEAFVNKDKIIDINSTPNVSFSMSMQELEKDVFKTNFDVKIEYKIKGNDCETKEKKEYNIYGLEMLYSGFVHIDDSENVPEIERKRILLVDIAYLIFPAIRHTIFNLTRDMQSTPVNLNPINFAELFEKEQKASESAKEAAS